MCKLSLSHVQIMLVMAAMAAAITASADALPSAFQVIPELREVELRDGPGLEFGGLKAVHIRDDTPRPIMGPILSPLPQTAERVPGTLMLRLTDDPRVPSSPEGYVLRISEGRAAIGAHEPAGLFYGCQTLEQLLEDARDTGATIPACTITDYPALSYRAVHFDVKHHLDRMEYYYDSINRLARYKINAIIFEFEDKLGYRRRPLVGAPHAISIEEMAALTAYARDRHIEISPLVQGMGHAGFILKHPELAHLRENPENPWAFCPQLDETYALQFDLYLDAIEATPGSRYVHIGGDEVRQIGLCERCKPIMDEQGDLPLFLMWLERTCAFVDEQGRTPILWDDMIFKHADLWDSLKNDMDPDELAQLWGKGIPLLDELLKKYPENAVYMRWNYTLARQEGNIRALDWFRERGLPVMIGTAAQNTSMLIPLADRVDVTRSFVGLAAERELLGLLSTAWDDASPHMETYWRGFVAAGEFGWSPEGRTLEEYERAYLQRAFGPEWVGATDLYKDLSDACVFWDLALRQGTSRRRDPKVIDLPDLATPGAWSQKHEERLDRAQQEVEQYARVAPQLGELTKKARRNRYHLELLAAINDFQVTASHLLLALKACDVAEQADRAPAMKEVRRLLDEFDQPWARLQAVYAKTRFLTHPEGFVHDRYHHVASHSTDHSWMVEADKEYHARVREWLDANGG